MKGKPNVFYRIYCFYRDGFRGMTIGKTLWTIIFIKLFIMFAILKVFFFPAQLAGMSGQERSEHVREQLLNLNP